MTSPSYWQILTISEFDTPAQPDLAGLLFKRALKASIGAQPLTRQLSAHHAVSIIVEDLTRASPKKEILPVLLEALEAIGIPPQSPWEPIALYPLPSWRPGTAPISFPAIGLSITIVMDRTW